MVKYIDKNRIQSQETHNFLFVKADRKHYKIAIDDILYIESVKDYISIYTPSEKIMVLENMKDIVTKHLKTVSFASTVLTSFLKEK